MEKDNARTILAAAFRIYGTGDTVDLENLAVESGIKIWVLRAGLAFVNCIGVEDSLVGEAR